MRRIDEALSQNASNEAPAAAKPAPLSEVARNPGIEFILATGDRNGVEAWGVENSDKLGRWTRETVKRFQDLGERLKIGDLDMFNGETSQRRVLLVRQGGRTVLRASCSVSITAEAISRAISSGNHRGSVEAVITPLLLTVKLPEGRRSGICGRRLEKKLRRPIGHRVG